MIEVCHFRYKFRDGFENSSSANVAEKDILYPLRKDSFLKLEIILVRQWQTQCNLQNILSSLPDLANGESFSLLNKNETVAVERG